jgi:putative transposase
MPGTYTLLLFHIVFSTKHREPWIDAAIADDLYGFMGGIIRSERGVLLAAGGIEDHVHLFVRWRADGALSDLMRATKAQSSKWIHGKFPRLDRFAWQEGYAAFSVSASQEVAVRQYIARQREHHASRDFRSELLRLLAAHGIEFEERYVFD